jgi:ABC-type sugar transport system ATPase subunit
MKILRRLPGDSGSITWIEADLSTDPKTAEETSASSRYQNFHLIPHLSVAENLAMPMLPGSRVSSTGKRYGPWACAREDRL